MARVAQPSGSYSPPWSRPTQGPLRPSPPERAATPPIDQHQASEQASADRALGHALAAVMRLEQAIRSMHANHDPRIWDTHTDIDDLTSRWMDSRADDPEPAK